MWKEDTLHNWFGDTRPVCCISCTYMLYCVSSGIVSIWFFPYIANRHQTAKVANCMFLMHSVFLIKFSSHFFDKSPYYGPTPTDFCQLQTLLFILLVRH